MIRKTKNFYENFEKTKMQKSVLILAVALLVGLAADGLFRNTVSTGIPIGLGIPLFVQLLACATIFIAFKSNMPLGRKGLYFLLPALAYSVGFVLRGTSLAKADKCPVFRLPAQARNSERGQLGI